MKEVRKITFVINATKPEASTVAHTLMDVAKAAGAVISSTSEHPLRPGTLEGQDACCVIGGDGTLLSVAVEAVAQGVPVLAVNVGKLGFLATYSVQEAKAKMVEILEGDYNIVKRELLRCRSQQGGERLALNDVVIRAQSSRLAEISVHCGGDLVNEYFSDGIIFSTPTGSTAYNLSAGGPIIHPSAAVVSMTPICPHTLTNRSVIFDNRAVLTVNLTNGAGPVIVSTDGQVCFTGHQDVFPLEIQLSTEVLQLMQPHNFSYFSLLRRKLSWGENRG